MENHADVDADSLGSVDMDEVMKIFEVPEMDEETRILYIVGLLGGPTSPYQILPAYDPEAELGWFIFDYMMKAYSDALKKFADGEYNALQVQAYIYISERMLANYLTGLPLDLYTSNGQLTRLGEALVLLESGEMILRKIPPSHPIDMSSADAGPFTNRFGGSDGPGGGGSSKGTSIWKKIWTNPFGIICGLLAFVGVAALAFGAGIAVAGALAIAGVALLTVKVATAAFDVFYPEFNLQVQLAWKKELVNESIRF